MAPAFRDLGLHIHEQFLRAPAREGGCAPHYSANLPLPPTWRPLDLHGSEHSLPARRLLGFLGPLSAVNRAFVMRAPRASPVSYRALRRALSSLLNVAPAASATSACAALSKDAPPLADLRK